MAARQIIVPGAMPSRDANGRALPAKLRFYAPDTAFTTPKTVYTTSALTVAHSFPILSDSAGRWPQIWADEAQTFDVTWSRLDNDAQIAQYTDLRTTDDAVLASVALAEAAADAAEAAQEAAEAAVLQAEALLAEHTGSPFTATSSSSVSIGVGTKTFVLNQEGTLFVDGQFIGISRPSPYAANRMVGYINGITEDEDGVQTLTVVTTLSAAPDGAGPYSEWSIFIAAENGVLSVAGLTGVVTGAALKAALGITAADITDFNAKVDARAIAFALAL
jgi:hypothetical protein